MGSIFKKGLFCACLIVGLLSGCEQQYGVSAVPATKAGAPEGSTAGAPSVPTSGAPSAPTGNAPPIPLVPPMAGAPVGGVDEVPNYGVSQGHAASPDNPESVKNPGKVYIYIEAESGVLSSGIQTLNLSQASAGKAIQTVDAQPSSVEDADVAGTHISSEKAVYRFTVPQGRYGIWGRVNAPDSGQDSFFVFVDDKPNVDLKHDVYDTNECHWGSSWVWTQVGWAADRSLFGPYGPSGSSCIRVFRRLWDLGAGEHTVTFRKREGFSMLDRILITNDLDFVPTK